MILAALLAAGYLWLPHRSTSRAATMCWLTGCAGLALAFSPQIDDAAHSSFVAHMAQHLLLIFVSAPLLALGRPFTRWMPAALRIGRIRKANTIVVATTIGLIGVLYLTHLPAFYDAALDNPALHGIEHTLYLTAGSAFWISIVQCDPLPRRAGYGARIAALLATSPATGLLAAAIGSASSVLYPAQHTTLENQRAGAAMMWIAPMLVVLPSALCLVLRWAGHEERTERRIPLQARVGHGRPRSPLMDRSGERKAHRKLTGQP